MKVISAILTALSYLAIPVLMLIVVIESKVTGEAISNDNLIKSVIIGGVFFILLGYLAHRLITPYWGKGKGCNFLFVITFVPFAIPFAVIGLIYLLLCIINKLSWYLTERYLVSDFLAWLKKSALGINDNRSVDATEKIYTVLDGGYERELKFYEYNKTSGPTADECRHYYRFRDDIGNFWRSYDNCETFVKERAGQLSYEI